MKKMLNLLLVFSFMNIAYAKFVDYGIYFGKDKKIEQKQKKTQDKKENLKEGKYSFSKKKEKILTVSFYKKSLDEILKTLEILDPSFNYIKVEENLNKNLGNLVIGPQENQGNQGEKEGNEKRITLKMKGTVEEILQKVCDMLSYYLEKKGNTFIIKKYKIYNYTLPINFYSQASLSIGEANYHYEDRFLESLKNILKGLNIKESYVYLAGNTLIVVATKEDYEKLRPFLSSLKYKKIKLKVTLYKITDSKDLQTGMNLKSIFNRLNTNLNINALASLSSGLTASYNTRDFQFLISALEKANLAKEVKSFETVTFPLNLVSFTFVDQVPMITVESEENDNGQTTTTTKVDFKDAGIKINILPYFLNNKIGYNVYVDLSALKDYIETQDAKIPVLTESKIYTNGVVNLNETMLIGLYSIENLLNQAQGTPILSRIPVLRLFFSSTTKSKEKSKLIISISAKLE